jgi:hypothetical protein
VIFRPAQTMTAEGGEIGVKALLASRMQTSWCRRSMCGMSFVSVAARVIAEYGKLTRYFFSCLKVCNNSSPKMHTPREIKYFILHSMLGCSLKMRIKDSQNQHSSLIMHNSR